MCRRSVAGSPGRSSSCSAPSESLRDLDRSPSPATWPRLSLTILKRSRSMNNTAQSLRARVDSVAQRGLQPAMKRFGSASPVSGRAEASWTAAPWARHAVPFAGRGSGPRARGRGPSPPVLTPCCSVLKLSAIAPSSSLRCGPPPARCRPTRAPSSSLPAPSASMAPREIADRAGGKSLRGLADLVRRMRDHAGQHDADADGQQRDRDEDVGQRRRRTRCRRAGWRRPPGCSRRRRAPAPAAWRRSA